MGACARAVVETRFSEDAMVTRYENTLLEITGGPERQKSYGALPTG